MATYKGKTCTIVKRHNSAGKAPKVTVRFNGTGSEMTIPASRLNKRKAKKTAKRRKSAKRSTKRRTTRTKRRNPWISFEGHGKNRGRKKAGKKGRRPGVPRRKITFFASRTRAKGRRVSSRAPKGYSVIGTRKYKSKAAYTAAQKRRGKALTKHLRRNR